MRVTINDIARASGFSKTSVSFAFNDPGRISKETRDKILSIAESLGYVPDPMARNLSLRKIGTIGFLVPQAINHVFLNPYMNQILLGIGEACQKQDYSLTVVPPLRGRIFDGVRSAAVDGFITMGLHPQMKVVQLIRQRHIPFVTIDGTPADEIPGVNTYDERSAFDMMNAILDQGHRRVVVFALEYAKGQEDDIYTGVRDWRLNGFYKAFIKRGLDPAELRVMDCESSMPGGQAAVSRLFADRDKGLELPSAIACMSDIAAIGAIVALQERGLIVPGDISVTGFDDIPEARLVSPRLTTVSQPGVDIGYKSASMLFALLEDQKTDRHVFFDSALVLRESLGQPG